MVMSDEELMKQYQAGSEEAFLKIYERYAQLIYSYISRRLHKNDTEDFYQEVWRKLHQKRELYSFQPFLPWFFVLIKNLLIDEYRASGSRKQTLERFRLASREQDIADSTDLDELLKDLPKDTAHLMREHFLEEKSYEDLAQELGISEGTIRQRLSRSMKTLRTKIRGAE
jgi:RNA polymerase sigma-70 factor (ECF subfamily)